MSYLKCKARFIKLKQSNKRLNTSNSRVNTKKLVNNEERDVHENQNRLTKSGREVNKAPQLIKENRKKSYHEVYFAGIPRNIIGAKLLDSNFDRKAF